MTTNNALCRRGSFDARGTIISSGNSPATEIPMTHEERERQVLAGPTQPEPSYSEQPDDTDDSEKEDDGPVDETDEGDNSAPGDTGSD
jgi:hypothetical protein